jgi:hypothetical protein
VLLLGWAPNRLPLKNSHSGAPHSCILTAFFGSKALDHPSAVGMYSWLPRQSPAPADNNEQVNAASAGQESEGMGVKKKKQIDINHTQEGIG